MTPEAAAEKATALLRLTQSDNGHEAASAASKLWAIIKKYGLEVEVFSAQSRQALIARKVEEGISRKISEMFRTAAAAQAGDPPGTRRSTHEAACGICGFWWRRGVLLRRSNSGHWVHFKCPTITSTRVDNSTRGTGSR